MYTTIMSHLHDDESIDAKPTLAGKGKPDSVTLILGHDLHLFINLNRVDELCAALVRAHAEAHAIKEA